MIYDNIKFTSILNTCLLFQQQPFISNIKIYKNIVTTDFA